MISAKTVMICASLFWSTLVVDTVTSQCPLTITSEGETRPGFESTTLNFWASLRLGRIGSRWGCSLVGRASVRHAADAGIFLLVNFQCRLSYGVRTSPCAIASIYICAHVKDPVVHVRVCWIMETLNTQHAP